MASRCRVAYPRVVRSHAVLSILLVAATSCAARTSSDAPTGAAAAAFEVPATPPGELRVLTYNVFLRPEPISFGDQTSCRAQRIGGWLARADADIVALTETFHPDDVSSLMRRAADRFPHRVVSQPSGSGLLGVSGGLSILSRWPIEASRTLTYSSCSGPFSDCVAAKGAVHAVLRVAEHARVNVVATHLDAGGWRGDRKARAAQLAELRAFVDEIDPAVGPTIVLGDFNIDALADGGEYEELLERLGVRAHSVDQPSTLNCKTTIRCEEPVPAERLDYIFTHAADRRLQRRSTEHLPMEDPACGARFLSDHRAVRATFAVEAF